MVNLSQTHQNRRQIQHTNYNTRVVLNDVLLSLSLKTFIKFVAQQYKIGVQWPEAKMFLYLHNELALNVNLPSFSIISNINK